MLIHQHFRNGDLRTMNTVNEEKYIRMRLRRATRQSIPFYLCRLFPVKKNKIVFTCIEGTTGYTCNPKYIAEEFIRYNKDKNSLSEGAKKDKSDTDEKSSETGYELVWLVNDITKKFPPEIKVRKNTLWNRAYHLSTAKFWIDNSRKQLEARKRKGQIYIQTWHAKLGFKPTCLDRGASFSKIAYLVSKHDSDMVDYWLSNSDWYDATLKTGSLYEGKTIRCGSPRCDILVHAKEDKNFKNEVKSQMCEKYGIKIVSGNDNRCADKDMDVVHFLMYAPTFRGGSQGTDRKLQNDNHAADYQRLKENLQKRFGGRWYILLRLHPQLVVRNLDKDDKDSSIIDVSRVDDMYEILAGCDAFMTDYSSAAFDACIMGIPVFLYCDDYAEYEGERGSLLWNLKSDEFPFTIAENDDELEDVIDRFDMDAYGKKLVDLYEQTGMVEDGRGATAVVEFITGRRD